MYSSSDTDAQKTGGMTVTIVLQSDARAAIIANFGGWAETRADTPATAVESRAYYTYLRANKQHLLGFRHPNPDKWQVVHSWLSDAGLVAD